jgi:hypothetical protein
MQSAAIPPLSGQHSKFLCLVELARAAERTCSVTGLRQTPCRKPRTYMGTSKLFPSFTKFITLPIKRSVHIFRGRGARILD